MSYIKMKIIDLHHQQKECIEACIQNNRKAQFQLYKAFSAEMLSLCRMYIKDLHYAEDVMSKAFLKAFAQLKNFKFQGSFEGWLRKIMIRESIDFLRSQKKVEFPIDDFRLHEKPEEIQIIDDLERIEEAQQLIDELPSGYKMVFVMYEVEGYRHKEIAQLLSISENTSKSQLFKARKYVADAIQSKKIANERAE